MFWLSEAYYGLLLLSLQFPGFYYTFTPTRYYGNTPFYISPLQTIYFLSSDSLPPEGFSRCIVLENSLSETGIQRIMLPRIFKEKQPVSRFDVFTGDYSKGLSAYLGNHYFDINFFGAMGYLEDYYNGNKRNAGVLSAYRKIPGGYLTLFATTKQDAGAYLKWKRLKVIIGYQDSIRYNVHLSSRLISAGIQDNRFYVSGLVPLIPPLFTIYFWVNQDKEYLLSPSYILTEDFSVYAFKSSKDGGVGIHSSILNLEINQNMDILCGINTKYINGFLAYKGKRISGSITARYSKSFKNGKLSPEIRIKALREDTLNHLDVEFLLHIIDASIYAGAENLTEDIYDINDGLLPDGYMRYYWGISWHFTE